MAHQAIYRKWRPMVFEDVVGQNHITKTLRNQIMSNSAGHAYLFCGTRGTGKTTCAKIFSRAVNCLNPQNGSPCNECEICRGIINGSILDVNEMDAASNRRIDDIREIINDVYYVASTAKYTVYIIDEVHMLTNEAFNALLKTLEEPPERVIFILATTDPQKVPQTILSRCQRFDFRRIRVSDIILRLKEIAHGDGLEITEDAYKMLARLGDGSMRDALSVLERIVSACGNKITADDIIDTLGISKQETVFNMADAVIGKRTDEIISIIDSLMADGRDLNTFIDDLIQHFRNLMICSISEHADEMLDYAAEDMIKLKAQSSKLNFEKISHAASLLANAKAEAKWIKSPRVIYELALIKLTRPEIDSSPEALLDRLTSMEQASSVNAPAADPAIMARLDRIEKKLENGIVQAAPAEPEKKEQKKNAPARLFTPIPKDMLYADNPVVITAKKWDNIVQTICKSAGYLFSPLNNRPITIDGDGIILLFKRTEKTARGILEINYNKFISCFKKASGTDMSVKIAYDDELENDIIDIWSLPQRQTPQTVSPAPSQPEPQAHVVQADDTDPLDSIEANFSEIVEISDDSEFVDYNSSENTFSQSSLDYDDDKEEFLEEKELPNDED